MALPSAADFTGPGVTEAQFKSALAKLLNYVENEAGGKPGDFVFTGKSTPPTGTIKANGAAVARSVYANLDAAIYVGNANNPTADYGYRCTDPLKPTTTRSVSGAYIVVPDMRGEVLIGWDDGRGVDSGRKLLSWKASQNKSHSHIGTATSAGAHTHSTSIPNRVDSPGGTWAVGSGITSGSSPFGSSSAGGHTHTVTTVADGGAEAMPRTVAVLVCIKY